MSVSSSKQAEDAKRNWYAVHTNSGYENAVVKNLKQRIASFGLEDYIFDVVVPTEKVVKVRGKKKVEEDRKIYPGYVLVDMIVTDKSWWVVRNTPRVTGFLGTGVHPVPVTETEIADVLERMKGERGRHSIAFDVGEPVKIIDGPFSDTEGIVKSVDKDSGQVTVSVSMFGRDTEVELDFAQVKAI